MPKDTIDRKIYFFFVNVGVSATGEFIAFDPRPALKAIDALAFDTDGKYLVSSYDDAVYCLFVDSVGPNRSRARWAKIRRTGFPEIENHGDLRALDIEEEEGIAEKCHMIFFPNNVIGVESNWHGPRATRLALYFRRKAADQCPSNIIVEPLIRRDIKERLKKLRDVRLVSITATASFAGEIAKVDAPLGQAFKSSAAASNAYEIEITMKGIQQVSGVDRVSWLRNLADRIFKREGAETEISGFKVRGESEETEHVETFDLISDKLVAVKKVLRQHNRSRIVDSDSAYAAIQEAYEEAKADIDVVTEQQAES